MWWASLPFYTRTHFLQEEVGHAADRLRRARFSPGTAQQVMTDVERYKHDLDEGRNPTPSPCSNFLRDWLVQHIQKSDKLYSDQPQHPRRPLSLSVGSNDFRDQGHASLFARRLLPVGGYFPNSFDISPGRRPASSS